MTTLVPASREVAVSLIGGKKAGGVREEEKKKERRETGGEGGGGREIACFFCMLITDVGKARSRFCWETFISHEKAGCLLKNYLQAGGRRGSRRSPTGQGTVLGLELQGGKERLKPWLSQVPLSLGGKEVLYFEATSSTDCFPQTASPGRCLCGRLSLPFLCLVLACIEASRCG